METVDKEGSLLFKSEMVQATLAGRKTQTRRILKLQETGEPPTCPDRFFVTNAILADCPYGRPKEKLWVRENWRTYANLDGTKPSDIAVGTGVEYEAGGTNLEGLDELSGVGKLRPSIFLPKWASRITLRITDVRLERVQDISEADAQAEGCERPILSENYVFGQRVHPSTGEYRDAFQTLWDSINASRGYTWESNPWVWVIEFKRIKP